jgi:nucleotide-binding universal stress UspA family protein
MREGGLMKTILVGVDGSEHADKAVEFGAEEADLRGAELLVVAAWDIPMVVDPMAALAGEWFDRLQEDSANLVKRAVDWVAERYPGVECRGKVVEGNAATVMLKEAENADMVVLGGRGRGGFASLLLGSVTAQVIHYARCPVVVVRAQPAK